MQRKLQSIGKYQVQKKIGYGGQSKVYLVSENGRVCAAKVYEPGESKIQLFKNQTMILSKIKNPLMINMIQALSSKEILWENGEIETRNVIILEHAQHGQLLQLIQKEGALQENTCKKIFQELLSAIQILHNQGIFHRDIKLDNILIDKQFRIKLADFGLSKLLEDVEGERKMTDIVGTQGFKSPEMENGNSYQGDKSDIFAVGVVLFTMFSGYSPFSSSKSSDKLYKLIREKNYARFWKVHERKKSEQGCNTEQFYPEEFRKLMNSFFSNDPEERPTLEELKSNSWLKSSPIDLEGAKTQISLKIMRSRAENPESVDTQSKSPTQEKPEEPKKATQQLR